MLASMTASPAKAEVSPHFQPFAFLANSCWSGTRPDGTIDTHCWEWVYDGAHLRDRHSVAGAKATYHGETIYSWDPAKQRVIYRYFNSTGGYSDGDFQVIDGALVSSTDTYVDSGGKQEFRTTISRLDVNRYEARTETHKENQWKPAWRVEFKRVAAEAKPEGENSNSK
jgi:hypothetical protein